MNELFFTVHNTTPVIEDGELHKLRAVMLVPDEKDQATIAVMGAKPDGKILLNDVHGPLVDELAKGKRVRVTFEVLPDVAPAPTVLERPKKAKKPKAA